MGVVLRLIAVIDRIVEDQAQIPPADQHRNAPDGADNRGHNDRPTGQTIEPRRMIIWGQRNQGFRHTANLIAATISPAMRERTLTVRSRMAEESCGWRMK